MIRFSKTISHVSAYLILTSLLPVMLISIFMISIKGMILKGYESLSDFGTWLRTATESFLTLVQNLGITALTFCLIFYATLIFFLVLINSRKSYKQRLGNILGIVIGVLLIIISLLPISVSSSFETTGPFLKLVFGLLFFTFGLNALLLVAGSVVGFLSAKTNVDIYETKPKKDDKDEVVKKEPLRAK